MKIFLLTPRFPFPENGGDVLRINSIARYLKTKNAELVLLSFYDAEPCIRKEYFDLYDTIYLIRRKRFVSLFYSAFFMLIGRPMQCGYYHSFRFSKRLSAVEKEEKPDIYISHLVRMAQYLDNKRRRRISIIEMTDALSKTYSLSGTANGFSLKKMVYSRERSLIKKYEKHIIEVFPKVVLVSDSDIDFLRRECCLHGKNLVCKTNGVECLPQISYSYDKRKICFVGNMRTLQNQDAVLHFVYDIFPIIKKSVPDAVFFIIGAQPPESIMALADGKNIVVTGFVDDIQKAVSDSCVAVAPVRIAAGIQNKVLVAMGASVPVVLSSLVAGGIPELLDGKNCCINDDDISFAKSCISLMCNAVARQKIALAGYEIVKKNYSWNENLSGYEILSE